MRFAPIRGNRPNPYDQEPFPNAEESHLARRTSRLSFTNAQVAAFRVHRHHLDGRAPRARLPAVVGDVCGVQAQVTAMARIALWARLQDLTIDDIERALVQKRTIVKTWSMRGTLHLHPSSELMVYVGGLMPTRLRHEQRWIDRVGMKEEETTAMILEALKDGPLTRVELAKHLAEKLPGKTEHWSGGWGSDTAGSGKYAWYLVRPAMVRGLVCFGPSNGQEITFARVDQWLRNPRLRAAEDGAEEALVRRYFGSFGPADAKDFKAWSGVLTRQITPIFERLGDELVEADVEGHRSFLLRNDVSGLEDAETDRGTVRLLPSFDPFMLGHLERGYLVDRAYYKKVYKDAGWLAPVVLLDGRVVGTWSYERQPRKLGVGVTMFKTFNKEIRRKVKEEAEDLARFLEVPAMSLRFT